MCLYGLEPEVERYKRCKTVRGIQEFDKIKYLGITIDNSRQCFTTHVGNSYNGARKMLAVLYSILGTCCNRLLIGKTFWKGLALSNFMYGSDVVVYGSNGLGKLQSFDNQAYRYILGLPRNTAACGIRSEIGASSALARDMKNKLQYVKHALNSNNSLLREIAEEELVNGRSVWSKTINGYMKNFSLERRI